MQADPDRPDYKIALERAMQTASNAHLDKARELDRQGELNIDVTDSDACQKLCRWFDDRWDDKWSLDISRELIEIIETSWVRPATPFHIYLKMAYHLSREARAGQAEFDIPQQFGATLFDVVLLEVIFLEIGLFEAAFLGGVPLKVEFLGAASLGVCFLGFATRYDAAPALFRRVKVRRRR